MFYKLDLDDLDLDDLDLDLDNLDNLDLDLDLDDLDLDMESCFYNPTRDHSLGPPPHRHDHPGHHPNHQTCLISWM